MIEDPMTFGIELTILGLVVVFVALVVISGLVGSVLGNVDEWMEKLQRRGAQPAPAPSPEPMIEEEVSLGDLTPEVVAAISAAIAVTIGKQFQIRRVRYRQAPGTNWSVQGRTTIMARRQLKPY